jgi:hypothetical protein
LERFGVRSASLPKVLLHHPELPNFFHCLRALEDSVLRENVRKALALLKIPGLRRHHLIVDETCVAGGYDLAYGLHPESSEPWIVGGGWRRDGSDWAMLDPKEHVLSKLPEDQKSRMYMDVVMTRNDTNRWKFHLCSCVQLRFKCFPAFSTCVFSSLEQEEIK